MESLHCSTCNPLWALLSLPQATTVSELVKLVARTLQLQGMEGVPGINDKTWETAGPLGALQRVLGMTTTQLAMLFGQNEDAGKQLRAAQAKLDAEKDSNSKLQVRGRGRLAFVWHWVNRTGSAFMATMPFPSRTLYNNSCARLPAA